MNLKIDNTALFYPYLPLIFIYAVANGWLFSAGSLLSVVIPMIFVLYAVLINVERNIYYKNTAWVYIYMLYVFILVFFSSDVLYSLKNVLKSFLPLLYFGLAVVFVNSYRNLYTFMKSVMVLAFLFLLNLVISNVFNLGGGAYADYETNYLQTGSVFSEGLNAMGYYVVFVPAILSMYPFKNDWWKKVVQISSVLIVLSLLLVLKRGPFVVIGIGYICLFLTSGFTLKNNLLKIVFVSFMLLLITFPLYESMLNARLGVRQERLTLDAYESEARYLENEYVINDILRSGKTDWSLFGHDVLNSPGNYGNGAFGDRQLHNDYAQVLNGSGVIGFALYFMMNISIFLWYWKLQRKLRWRKRFGKREKMLNAVFIAFFVAYFALGTAGSIDSIVYNVFRFMVLGSVIGVFRAALQRAPQMKETAPRAVSVN